MQVAMERTVTKQVRLTKEEARKLQALAKRMDVTESDVLRSALDLAEKELERKARRDAAWEGLMRLAVEVPGKKIPFRMK